MESPKNITYFSRKADSMAALFASDRSASARSLVPISSAGQVNSSAVGMMVFVSLSTAIPMESYVVLPLPVYSQKSVSKYWTFSLAAVR